jgi:UTP-glucose-1-phosphate uridylyltransferase
MSLVKTAVVPCAGMGTRLRPLTRVVPKELLPWGDRPLIEQTLEELALAGIERTIIVLRKEKELLRTHLEGGGIPKGMQIVYVEQKQPKGLADALLAAKAAIGDQPFLMALPDQQLPGGSAQLVAHYDNHDSLSSAVDIPAEELQFFPGAVAVKIEGEGPVFKVLAMLPGDETELCRAFGRTVFHPRLLKLIPEGTDESGFGLVIAKFLRSGKHGILALEGRPADLGILDGYVFYQKDAPRKTLSG